MAGHATATSEVKTWDEQTYQELEGAAKLTRASVTQSLRGDIEGESTVELLMMYPDESSASFVGLQHVVGRIGDRPGSFVLQVSGTYARGTAESTYFVVPGSGTGELRGIRGEGRAGASQGPTGTLTLDYDVV